MKSIVEINEEIKQVQKEISSARAMNSKHIALSNRNKFLIEIKMYLETSPSEAYLKQEKKYMLNIISSKESQYTKWSSDVCLSNVDVNKRRAMFNREVGITGLNKRIKTLNYILQ